MYTIAAVSSVIFWSGMPLMEIIQKDQFFYTDYRVPIYLPGEPFTRITFTCGVLFEMIGSGLTIAKKTSIDVYMIHMITLLTSEYRYIGAELENIFGRSRTSNIDHEKNDKNFSIQNENIEKSLDQASMRGALKRLIHHHELVMQ